MMITKNEGWINFSNDISQQLEALYLQSQADMRRPNELVQILPSDYATWKEFDIIQKLRGNVLKKKKETSENKKTKLNDNNNDNHNDNIDEKNDNDDDSNEHKDIIENERKKLRQANVNDIENMIKNDNQFAVVVYPKEYYSTQKNSTNEEISKYKPYSIYDNQVNIVKLDPSKMTHEKIKDWMNGSEYHIGSQLFATCDDKNKQISYAKSIIIDKVVEKGNKWYFIVHPMPSRNQCIHNAQMMDISRLQYIHEGRRYRAYLKNEEDHDNKYYVIDVIKNTVRCVNNGTIYSIRRQVNERTVEELWKDICVQINTKIEDDEVSWKQPKMASIQPLPLLDYKKIYWFNTIHGYWKNEK